MLESEYTDEKLTFWEERTLEHYQWAASNVMKKLYKQKKISEKLHQIMIEVINKCPNLQHLRASMDSFGYTQTIIQAPGEIEYDWSRTKK